MIPPPDFELSNQDGERVRVYDCTGEKVTRIALSSNVANVSANHVRTPCEPERASTARSSL